MTPLPIHGVTAEPQPIFGSREEGGVLHILSGGEMSASWFPGEHIHDVYACLAVPGKARGGHYHKRLDEQFYVVSGTALWVLQDFREDSPSFGVQHAVVLGSPFPTDQSPTLTNLTSNDGFVRLTVPHGVYHTVLALGSSPTLTLALGTTGYDKEDYVYPEVGMDESIIRSTLSS